LNEEQEQTFKESLAEILLLTKICLTSFWFWLPVLFSMLVFTQILMIFFIHPLSIFIAPAVVSLYAIFQEKKRLKARYNLGEPKKLSLGYLPDIINPTNLKWKDTEKTVEEFRTLIEKQKSNKKSR